MLQLLRVANLKCFFDKHIESILMSNFFHNYICKNQNFLNDKGLKISQKTVKACQQEQYVQCLEKTELELKYSKFQKQ